VTEGALIPLGFMEPGETGVLVEIRGLRHHHRKELHQGHDKRPHLKDRGHKLEHRLQHMGLTPGAPVRVVQNAIAGPIIVAVKDTRLALARGVAIRIMVRPGCVEEVSDADASPTTDG
jgi:ferrous iron transport protein A